MTDRTSLAISRSKCICHDRPRKPIGFHSIYDPKDLFAGGGGDVQGGGV